MSRPPASRPPGRKLPPAAKQEVDAVLRVRGIMSDGLLKKLNRPGIVGRSHSFLCDSGYYREPDGRFRKMDHFGRRLKERHAKKTAS